MAETKESTTRSAADDSTRSNKVTRQRMADYEFQLVQETKSKVNTAHRAVSNAILQDYGDDLGAQTYSKGKFSTPTRSLPANEVSIMHAKLVNKPIEDMWTDVKDVIEGLDNVDPIVNEELKRLIGNCYQAGSYCEFLVGLYQVQDSPILDFRRLCGDGFVMDSFYRKVREELHKTDCLQDEDVPLDMEDEGVFDCYSDSETEVDDTEDTYLEPNGFLQLSFDENLVNMWIEKINTRHIEDKNHMMGLMAHNALHPENLAIIVRQGGEKLVELCKAVLESENNSAAVPLVRNTSALVKELADKTDMWTEDCVASMFEAMTFWVPNNGRKEETKRTFEVTESRETVKNLVETLYLMKNNDKGAKVDEDFMAKTLANLESYSALQDYLENLQEQTDAVTFVRELFPQA